MKVKDFMGKVRGRKSWCISGQLGECNPASWTWGSSPV